MPSFGAKYSSAYIASDKMRDFITRLPSVIRDIYGDCNLKVFYGWACNLHQDLWHKPMNVPLDVFPYFMEDSVEQRIFDICGSNLLIEFPDSTLQILLGHESDMHLDGIDERAMSKIIASFPEIDFRTADQWRAHFDVDSSRRLTKEAE